MKKKSLAVYLRLSSLKYYFIAITVSFFLTKINFASDNLEYQNLISSGNFNIKTVVLIPFYFITKIGNPLIINMLFGIIIAWIQLFFIRKFNLSVNKLIFYPPFLLHNFIFLREAVYYTIFMAIIYFSSNYLKLILHLFLVPRIIEVLLFFRKKIFLFFLISITVFILYKNTILGYFEISVNAYMRSYYQSSFTLSPISELNYLIRNNFLMFVLLIYSFFYPIFFGKDKPLIFSYIIYFLALWVISLNVGFTIRLSSILGLYIILLGSSSTVDLKLLNQNK